jgi:hypothetical protein
LSDDSSARRTGGTRVCEVKDAPDAIACKSHAKLRASDPKAWREGAELGKSASNRTMTALKATLNLAIPNRQAPAFLAIELRNVTPHKNACKRRDLYLDIKQRGAPRGMRNNSLVQSCT